MVSLLQSRRSLCDGWSVGSVRTWATLVLVVFLLGFESEIGSSRLAGGNRRFLRLCPVLFLPSGNRVVSGREGVDCVIAALIGGCVGALYPHIPAMYLHMSVALRR